MLILCLKLPCFLPAPALNELSPPPIRSVDPPSLSILYLDDLNTLFLEVDGMLNSFLIVSSSNVDYLVPIPPFLDLVARCLAVSG